MPYAHDWAENLYEPRSHLRVGSVALASFMESSRRASLKIHELVRANGDDTPFSFEKGVLLRALDWIPAVLVGSEVAVHVIEYASQRAAVCSYNRVMRFDEIDHGETATLGLCLYMGTKPIAAKVASGEHFLRSELSLYVVEVPRTAELERVASAIRTGYQQRGVPEEVHPISKFIF